MAKISGMELMMRLDNCNDEALEDLDWMLNTAIALDLRTVVDTIQAAIQDLRCVNDILQHTEYGKFMGMFEAEERRTE